MSELRENRVLAFDVGGSHVAAAVCSGMDYQLGPVVSAPYAAISAADQFANMLLDLGVRAGATSDGTAQAMVAVPGPFDFQAGVSWMRHKLPYLYGFDLRGAIAARFGWQTSNIRFLNDADAFMLGEVGGGAARGFRRAVGFTLGTGIGSGFAIDGRLVTSGTGVPPSGEIWNVPFHGGIVEDSVSTRAIIGSYERRTGCKREVVEIASSAPTDRAAVESFEEFGRNLGEVVRTVLADFHPEVVVLGGGIARSAQLFLHAVNREIADSRIQVRISALGDRAALVGCAVAAFQSGGEQPDAGKSAPAGV